MSKKALRWLWVIFPILIFMSCSTQKESADLKQLLSYMTGSYSGQTYLDGTFFTKKTRMQLVQIWKERKDGYWLYREQAGIMYLDKPSHQIIYHLTQIDESSFKIDEFDVKDRKKFVGEWKKSAPMDALTPEALIERKGCSIILKKKNDSAFIGSIVGKACADPEIDAGYVKTDVKITATNFYIWDRFFDANDKQIWGPENNGFTFTKISDFEDPKSVKTVAQEFEDMVERTHIAKDIKAIRLIIEKVSDVKSTYVEYDVYGRPKTSQTTYSFQYNPEADIKIHLEPAKFKIIPKNSKEIEDAKLLVIYAERKKGGLDSPTTFHYAFAFEPKKADIAFTYDIKDGCGSVRELRHHCYFRHIGSLIKESLVEYVIKGETVQQVNLIKESYVEKYIKSIKSELLQKEDNK